MTEAFAYAIGNLTRRIIERLPTPTTTSVPPNGQDEQWLSDVPHLARLGIAGKTEDCRMLARRMAKNARKAGRAELADSLAAMAGAGSPLRAASAQDERGRTIAESPGTSTRDQASRE